MESLLLWTLLVFYGLWLLLTVIKAVSPNVLIKLRLPRAAIALLPNWNLFAPKPSVADYYVYYRDQSGTAAPGPWQVAYTPEARKWHHGIWNPNKVQAKAVFDLVQQLSNVVNQMEEGGEEGVLKSGPYLHLLHFVRHLPRKEAQERTQFSIVVREPAHQYEATLIVSPYYPL